MNDLVPESQPPCLDDDPDLARRGARQQFLNRWSRPLALAPFAVALFIIFKFFPDSTSPLPLAIVFLTLFWAVGLVSYSLYLRFWGGIRCPVCEQPFGSGDKCRNCDLPRHRRLPFVLPNLTGDD